MNLLRRKPAAEPAPVEQPVEAPASGKGRPTPKRRDTEHRRGPVAPPPKTRREALARNKASGAKLTKDERRTLAAERRTRMMAGEDAYVLPRDRGPVRAYVRDLVDARRNVAGVLLPVAGLAFVILLVPNKNVTTFGPIVLLVAIVAAVVDSWIAGRQFARKARLKFPKGDPIGGSIRGGSLGFYAFNRAILIRKWRVPRPRVERGAVID